MDEVLDQASYMEDIPFIANINNKLYKGWTWSIYTDNVKNCSANKDCFGNTLKIGDFVVFPSRTNGWNYINFLGVGLITGFNKNLAIVYISTIDGKDPADPNSEALTEEFYCCSLLKVTKNNIKKYKLQ